VLEDNVGISNTATGFRALGSNTTGDSNTGVGFGALNDNTTGAFNTAIGSGALFANTTANSNIAVGDSALLNNTTGSNNTAIGAGAGENLTIGDHNIDIANPGVAGESATIRIGDVLNVACHIGGIDGATVDPTTGTAVFVDANGKLGTVVSSRQFKDEIRPMDKTSEAILELQPVTFLYRKQLDPKGVSQFGLIAEDVAKVNSNLVIRDRNGDVKTVRYEAVNAMLLNEFLKEHKEFLQEKDKVQEQSAMIARLEKQVAALTAGLQNVTAQVEASKVSRQVALKVE
jgi:endosialidase-like protein